MLGQLVFGGVSFLANCGDILADSKAADAQADSIQGKSCEEIEASNGFASECVNLPYNRDICVAEYRRYIECKYEDQAAQQNLLKDCQLTCPTEIINAAPTPAPRWPTPTPTPQGGGADAASAGLVAGVVVGVAALAAIAFGAYVHMRSKGGILGSRRGCACGGRALVRASSRGRAIILTPTRAEIAEPKSSQSYERARARAGTVGERLPPAGAPGAQDLASLILCTQAVASRCPWCCPIV